MRGPGMHGFGRGGFGMGGFGRPMMHRHHHGFGHPPHHRYHHHRDFYWRRHPYHSGCGCLGCCTMLFIPAAIIVLAVLIFVL